MKTTVTACLALLLFLAAAPALAQDRLPVVIETSTFRYVIAPDGTNREFVDKKSGVDYLAKSTVSSCGWARKNGSDHAVRSITRKGNSLYLEFAWRDVSAVVDIQTHDRFVVFELKSVSNDVESVTFMNVPLTLKGKPNEPFAACAYSLNLITRVDQLPALQTALQASCHPKYGMVGAKAAMIGAPMDGILDTLKETVSLAEGMPLSKVGGPWAREVPFNHGSYLFNFGTLTESTVDDWIAMAKSLGVTQIDNHGGSANFFRFGDFELNREKWPEGWETYKRIVKKLHENGIGSIFHTYAFFIDKQSKYVTPVPDGRLDAFRTFTLASPVSADATEITVNESTKGMHTTTGFFVHNSVVLHIGDELVTFAGVTQEPPYRFTGLTRGALGTKAAAHDRGANARHLKECFGLFVPNPESSLFEEIAANHARVIDECGFDGMYLDAIDGCSILRGGEETWYWGDKFLIEIQKRLKKPVGVEASAMWHHFWQYRTRWQAWDYPVRGQKRFIDIHADGVNGGLLLPLHLGWWNFQTFNPPQVEPTYPDVIEYLGAKLIGWDAGISLTGAIDRTSLTTVPLYRRTVDILRTSEELRHAGYFSEQVKARLREPGKDYTLVTDDSGKKRFREVRYDIHKAVNAMSNNWTVSNGFKEQPARLRIEALMSVGSYDDPGAVVLADFTDAKAFEDGGKAAEGVTFSIDAKPTSGTKWPSGAFSAASAGKVPQKASWVRLDRKFEPLRDLSKHQALGMWVEGDGLGEVIAVRLESPEHISYGAVADRYLTVDFKGRRYVELVETESERWSDYTWNDSKWLYNTYRETINFSKVQSVTIWYQNLPAGKPVKCRIGAVKALPMISATIKNPSVTIGGKTVVFPVEMTSGSWIEYNSADDCILYGPKGETIAKITPKGAAPLLKAGPNAVKFSSDKVKGPNPRARVTVIGMGEML